MSAQESSSVAAFGTVFADQMGICNFKDGQWDSAQMVATGPIPMHPAAHVLHYGSSCFEGLKAYRWADGTTRMFRMDMHVKRMIQSAQKLYLPVPGADLLSTMIRNTTAAARDVVPERPGALYLRPTLIGMQPNIGAAASPSNEALLFILASPVGDYFAGGTKALRILVDDTRFRTAEQLGSTKTGGNYAAALGPTLEAKAKYAVDQVLFCPNGDVQETGAANFLLIDDNEVLTKPLGSSFLHGITRESILTLAADRGLKVVERDFTVDELLERAPHCEAALSGTAACLTPVGTLVYQGQEIAVGGGKAFTQTEALRKALCDIHSGAAPDTHSWLTLV